MIIIFGGEQSGHIILLDYNPTGDGILTSILAILVMLETGKSMSELKKCISIYPQVLINAKVQSSKKELYEEDSEISEAIINLKEEFKESGRVLIRPSGTESLIRVMLEGENQEYILEKAKELVRLIEKKLG
jgi:phosphoglucosamine mutase